MPPPRPGRSRRQRSREPSMCPASRESGGGVMSVRSVNIGHIDCHCRVLLLHSLCSWSRHTESPLHSSIIQGYHIISLLFSLQNRQRLFLPHFYFSSYAHVDAENISGVDETSDFLQLF